MLAGELSHTFLTCQGTWGAGASDTANFLKVYFYLKLLQILIPILFFNLEKKQFYARKQNTTSLKHQIALRFCPPPHLPLGNTEQAPL